MTSCDQYKYVPIHLQITKFVALVLIVLTQASPVEARTLSPTESFHILRDSSSVSIIVFRAGALGPFGHNHVISSHGITGDISLTEGPNQAGHFSLSLPFESLVVDKESEREAMGKGFRTEISDNAKIATRNHMMGPKVLDYPRFKRITVTGDLVNQVVKAKISLHGKSQSISVPTQVLRSDGKLMVRGDFSIKQSAFGIKPYHAIAGMLKIKDRIDIHFSINAEKK